MDNKSAFNVNEYDRNVRKVIPLYDEIYNQTFDLISTYYGNKPLSILDTGCGSGNFGVNAFNKLNIERLTMCDPSEKMLESAKVKLSDRNCKFLNIGSEFLDFNNEFDIVTAIQSHHYFNKTDRIIAVKNCYKALKPGGMFIYFENTAPLSYAGKNIVLKRIEKFGLSAGRSSEDVAAHSKRYNEEYFPININEHLNLLKDASFESFELFWCSYMQCGFYGIKGI